MPKASDDYKRRLTATIDVCRILGNSAPTLEQLAFMINNPPNAESEWLSFDKLALRINVALIEAGIEEETIKSQSLQKWHAQLYARELEGESEQKLGIYFGLKPEVAAIAVNHFLNHGKVLNLNKKSPNEISLGDISQWLENASSEDVLNIMEYGIRLLKADVLERKS